MSRPPPLSTLFPYTTLFRSADLRQPAVARLRGVPALGVSAGVLDGATRLRRDLLFQQRRPRGREVPDAGQGVPVGRRSEEHTSELQSRGHLVCRLLLEKKKK